MMPGTQMSQMSRPIATEQRWILDRQSEQPDGQPDANDGDDSTHDGGPPTIPLDTSSPPGPPHAVHFGIQRRSDVTAHRVAFRMLSDMLSRGAVHNRHITRGGSTATAARTIWPDANVTLAARPMAQIPRAQTAANDAFVYSSVMRREYSVVDADAVPDRTADGRRLGSEH